MPMLARERIESTGVARIPVPVDGAKVVGAARGRAARMPAHAIRPRTPWAGPRVLRLAQMGGDDNGAMRPTKVTVRLQLASLIR